MFFETGPTPFRHIGRRIIRHARLDSTNTFALSLDEDRAGHGLVIRALEQTAGRGQHGRTWHAPPGSSVLLSIMLYLSPELRRPAILTAWAVVAVSEALRKIAALEAKIKWPNDVYVDGKKVCGILIEQRSRGADQPPRTVVGIGLNVRQPAESFAQAGLMLAGSLHSLTGKDFDPDDVAGALLGQLDEDYALLHGGDVGALEGRWRNALGLVGAEVCAEAADILHEGRLIDVTFDALTLDLGAGRLLQLVPEAVRRLERT